LQEVLLQENAGIVRKIAQDIDESIEQAQKRYVNATQEVDRYSRVSESVATGL